MEYTHILMDTFNSRTASQKRELLVIPPNYEKLTID